jgi:hypothetical protein
VSSTSPTVQAGPSPAEQVFAQEYDKTFVEFVRHVVGQGVPVNERVMEGANERATKTATQATMARGYRSASFAPMAKAGLARMLTRYGY